MGTVHEAVDLETRRKVAIKRLRSQHRLPAEHVQRFRREILATAQISSKHVVAIHDAGLDEATGEPFMVMDYLQGEDLGVIADRVGTLPVETAIAIASQVCDGLIAAHAVGIVHRDIKPSNLFLLSPTSSGDRVIKIVDFGIARIRFGEGEVASITELTQTGAILGSPLYMSPEQLRGVKSLDHRADIWSLGVVLYRLLCGSVPHRGETVADLLVTVCSQPAPDLRSRAPWVADDLADLVHRAVAIDVAARIPTARAFAEELRRWCPRGATVTDAMLVSQSVDPPSSGGPVITDASRRELGLASTQARPEHSTPISVELRARSAPTATPPPSPSPSHVRRSTLGLLALLVASTGVFVLARRSASSREPLPDASSTLPPQLSIDDMPPVLKDSPGAVWFEQHGARCTGLELRALFEASPPPPTSDGLAFGALCSAVAGDLVTARKLVDSARPGDKPLAAGALYWIAHRMADRGDKDPAVAKIMRIVIEAWPENFQAMYVVGLDDVQSRNPRAEEHLRAFLALQPQGGFADTVRRVLAALHQHDCTHPIIDPLGHAISIPCP